MKSSSVASLVFLALLLVGVTVRTQAPAHADPDRARTGLDRGGDSPIPAPTLITREDDTRVPFNALDTEGRGYLTSADARKDDWTRRNFTRCNISHDGHLSEVEYTNCPE